MKPISVPSAFAAVAAVGLILAAALTSLTATVGVWPAAPIGAGVFAIFAGIAFIGLQRGYPHPRLGLCNTVTLLRLALASVLVALLALPGWSAWPLFTIAGLAFALDGLDGYFARREALASDFGARFDMEVDSIVALALAALAFQSGAAGIYVLLLGLPRYVFGLAQLFLPWLNASLPERFSRKMVCVLQIATLLLMAFPLAGSPLTDILAGVAAAALLWSFWYDIAWLRKAPRP